MKCPKCQADNPDDTLFCGKCGTKLEAEENYEKFLDLWIDADPGMAEAEDAKKRLETLKKSP